MWKRVFPTLVGVFLAGYAGRGRVHGLPHARGGVSLSFLVTSVMALSSPRSWGCFLRRPKVFHRTTVFPTLVGVFLTSPASTGWDIGLPHARGGVSVPGNGQGIQTMSSPRSWGCFRVRAGSAGSDAVFPTLVGVFLQGIPRSWLRRGLPHARGGVSISTSVHCAMFRSSPRSWGCFCPYPDRAAWLPVFPTLVGVFPLGSKSWRRPGSLPHARGGVSLPLMRSCTALSSSPRSWGCFLPPRPQDGDALVFPTLVGVFPGQGEVLLPHWRLPHARGGVSKKGPRLVSGVRSSPRSWGCFQDSLLHGGLSVRSGSYSMSCVLIQKR